MSVSKGQFVWMDLMVPDVEAAVAFYCETIGWKTMPFEGGDKPYTMFCVGEQPIGGVMELPDEVKAMNVPPHWIAYVAVDDVDTTVAQVGKLGGTVHRPGHDIPNVGRFAVIADPQGAVIAVFKPEGDMNVNEGKPRVGDVSWYELNTTDYESGWKFYQELFGWTHTESFDMGPDGMYFMYNRPGQEGSMGGMSNVAKTHSMPPHWLNYIHVDDVGAAVERIKSKGGKILNGPMEVPGGDLIAQCSDPQGAAFAVHGSAKN